MNKKRFILGIVLCLVLSLTLVACGGSNEPEEAEEVKDEVVEEGNLLVYSGAGLKNPMEEIRENFEEETGITLEIIYAGSGQLLAQLDQSGKGDIFIVGSKDTYDQAGEKDLTNEGHAVAHHTPVIITAKGNPKGIEGLADLSQEGLKVALGEKNSNAIGKTSREIFERNGLTGIEDNVVVNTGTVNELYGAIESGNADVAIVTRDGAINNENVEIIEIPEDQNIDQIIYGSTLKTSADVDKAERLIDYIISEGKDSFDKYGFKPVK